MKLVAKGRLFHCRHTVKCMRDLFLGETDVVNSMVWMLGKSSHTNNNLLGAMPSKVQTATVRWGSINHTLFHGVWKIPTQPSFQAPVALHGRLDWDFDAFLNCCSQFELHTYPWKHPTALGASNIFLDAYLKKMHCIWAGSNYLSVSWMTSSKDISPVQPKNVVLFVPESAN